MCQSHHWHQKHESPFLGGGTLVANLLAPAVVMPLRALAQRCQRLSPLLAAPAALVLMQGQAKAVLTYNIFERGSDVVIEANGSLLIPASAPVSNGCFGGNGRLNPSSGFICTGPGTDLNMLEYNLGLQPTTSFGTGSGVNTTNVSGTPTIFGANVGLLALSSSYVSGSPIQGEAIFASRTLSGFGITTTGLLGTWTLDGTGDTIQVFIAAPASVPGPLPLFGAAAAFGWSRRLRKRISTPLSTPPQS
jgi:hypothetical protein